MTSLNSLKDLLLRGYHTSAIARGGGAHGHEGYEAYLHAENMYNLRGMKNRKLKIGLAVLSVVAVPVAIGIFAISLQQRKAAG